MLDRIFWNDKEVKMDIVFEVSIIFITYNSKWEDIKNTLDSILKQENIEFEVVISDDGSEKNYYGQMEEYFGENNFDKYTFVYNTENVGTIRNCIKALNAAKGRYVKAISPGDLLIGATLLADWSKALEKSGRVWSFGRMICAKNTSDKLLTMVCFHAMPQDVTPYIENDDARARYNFVVCKDRAAGPTILCEKKIWLRYLKQLSTIIKYAEDFSYTLLVIDGYIPLYFPHNVVLYEVGSGISTSDDSKWNSIMQEENSKFYEYIKGYTEQFQLAANGKYNDNLYWSEYREKWTGLGFTEVNMVKEDYIRCCLSQIDNIRRMSKGKKIWIYGAGYGGRIMLELMLDNDILPEGFIDINHEKIDAICGFEVVGIENIDSQDAFLVIALIVYRRKVIEYIREHGIDDESYIYIEATKQICAE